MVISVLGAVDGEYPMDLKRADTLGRKLPFSVIGAKHDFRVAPTFNYFPMHLLVTPIVSGLAAGGVEYDLPANLSACRVEVDRTRLEGE